VIISLERVVRALQEHAIRFIVVGGLNFTLTTEYGDLDLLGDVTGGGTYEQLLPFAQEVTAFETTCWVISLEKLIQLKRAAGRPKDLEAIAELQALLEERRKQASPP
jgi:predicted nucleotidyltransferase